MRRILPVCWRARLDELASEARNSCAGSAKTAPRSQRDCAGQNHQEVCPDSVRPSEATMLQLPVQPTTQAEAEAQERIAYAG